jgi:lipoate-protein ligase A
MTDDNIAYATINAQDYTLNSTSISIMQSSFGGPAWELACDEALLETCEAGEVNTAGILRFWETDTPFVVLGYANKAALELNLPSEIPVFRRCTGGGSVLQGPGCLNYSLVLPMDGAPELASITQTNCLIMDRHAKVLASILKTPVRVEGHTDLAIHGRKFSGNSQRRKNRWLLFHGTFLLRCDFELMDKLLRPPPREPEYRKGRRHSDFLTTLDVQADAVRDAVMGAWRAEERFTYVPRARIEALVETKYSTHEWTFRT